MKRLFVVILCLLGVMMGMEASAQSRNAYFMEGSYFRTDLNPALAPTRGYVAIPFISGFGMNVNTNFLSVDNFFFQRSDQVVTALHGSVSADEFLGNLPETEKLSMNLKMNILSAGFHTRRAYWNFGVSLRSQTDMALSKDLFRILKTLGNGIYDLSNTSINTTNYMEAYVGTRWQVLDFLSVGGRVKFLMGLFNASTEVDQIRAAITGESISAQLHSPMRMSGLMLDSSKVVPGSKLDDTIFADEMGTIMGNLFSNMGAAIDLGAEATFLDDRLRASIAVTDLGFIRWNGANSVAADAKADFYFRGLNLDTEEADTDSHSDFYATDAGKGYTTRLACSLNVGVEYNILKDRIGFGLMSHTEFGRTMTLSELTASVNFRPVNWFSATVSHTFCAKNKLGIFGFALNLHPTGFNLYLGADYLGLNMVSYGDMALPRSMKSVNLYMGIGFNLGRAKTTAKAE